MISRTVEISQEPLHVAVRREQLILVGRDEECGRSERASIPCEDLGVLLVDHCGTTFTHAALTTLMRYKAAVVLCGADHLPAGMILPLGDHSEIVRRLNLQIRISRPLRKQLWKQLVQAKIRGQATNLPAGSRERTRLLALARNVKSGDTSNSEAQAARVYWSVWLVLDAPPLDESAALGFSDDERVRFRRDPDGAAPNNLLNYGYAVMRAAVARALVAAGLHPALGIAHSNRANAFCLADDFVEPLRPIVDDRVRELHGDGQCELIPSVKQALLELLAIDVTCGEQRGPLTVALHRMASSYVSCLEGKSRLLLIPELEDGEC